MGAANVANRISIDSFSKIYQEYVPAITNLYTIELFGSETSASRNYSTASSASEYLKFHSTAVDLPEHILNLERDQTTKTFKLSGSNPYTRAEELSLTWREADDWKVRKYHEDWLAKFYDKEHDCFISYDTPETAGLAQKMVITLPASVSSQGISSGMISENRHNQHQIALLVLPHNTGKVSLAWSTNPGIVAHQLSYYILDWNWV